MDLLVTESRQDSILQGFMAAKNWKQAVAHCDKRLKKEKNYRLAINRALILLQWPDAAQQLKGKQALHELSLVDQSDPEVLAAIEKHTEVRNSTAWEAAVKKEPTKDTLYIQWYESKFAKSQFGEAAKASLAYFRSHPSDHSQFLRGALCYYLSADCSITTTPSSERKLHSDLAVAMLQQAAKNTPIIKDNGRTLKTSQDLELCSTILMNSGKFSEALAILDNKEGGLDSTRGSWHLVTAKIAALRRMDQHAECLRYCFEVIRAGLNNRVGDSPQTPSHCTKFSAFADDWNLWQELLNALGNSGPGMKDMIPDLQQLFQSYIERGSINALLLMPRLRHIVTNQHLESADEEKQTALEAECTIFERLGHSPRAVDYLYTVKSADISGLLMWQMERLGNIKQTINMAQETPRSEIVRIVGKLCTYIRTKYLAILATPKGIDVYDELEILAGEGIWVYIGAYDWDERESSAENGLADEALLVAAACCARLSTRGAGAFYYALLVMQTLLARSPHNYKALVMLTRLCRRLGAITKSMACWRRLEIKNTQYFSCSWIVLDRISSLQSDESIRAGYRPLQTLTQIRTWMEKRVDAVTDQIRQSDECASWTMVFKMLNFKVDTITSFARICVLIEAWKILIRTQEDASLAAAIEHDLLTTDIENLKETRDYASIRDDGDDGAGLEAIAVGPRLTRTWVWLQCDIVRLHRWINDQPDPTPRTVIDGEEHKKADGLTTWENIQNAFVKSALQAVQMIGLAIRSGELNVAYRDSVLRTSLLHAQAALETIMAETSSMASPERTVIRIELHAAHTILDTLDLIEGFTNAITLRGVDLDVIGDKVSVLAVTLRGFIKRVALCSINETVEMGTKIPDMSDAWLGGQVRMLVGQSRTSEILNEINESMLDGLEAVVKRCNAKLPV